MLTRITSSKLDDKKKIKDNLRSVETLDDVANVSLMVAVGEWQEER